MTALSTIDGPAVAEAYGFDGTKQSAVATSIHSPGDASAQEHCQGSDGAEVGGSLVLDVAE